MCVVSMVIDRFEPMFPPEPDPLPAGAGTFVWSPLPSVDLDELRLLIEQFKEAMAAAKVVDRLTNQPDCEDPEKVKLVARVRELELELEILKLRARVKELEDEIASE